jgi:hypothetical protein
MAFWDFLRPSRRGRPPTVPKRDTLAWPNLTGFGQPGTQIRRVAYKPTPKNLRYFSRTPMARRAINTIKNPISQMAWKIVPKDDVTENSEIKRQCQLVTDCLNAPNNDDNFHTFVEQIIEDIMCGAGAAEIGRSTDPLRPVWLWPVDGLSIQMFPAWAGGRSEARYLQTIGYGSYASMGQGDGIKLRNDELIYIRPNPTTATPFGFGPLEIAFNSITRLLTTGDFAGKVAGNALPGFLLDLGEVTPDYVRTFRKYWSDDVEGNGTVPIVATEMVGDASTPNKARGATVQRLYPEGDSALYLAYQEFLRSEIAAAFDISNMNLNVERDVNRSTAEVMEDRDWDGAIKPCANLVAQHFQRDLIEGTFGFSQIKFMWEGIDREDEEATSKILGSYFDRSIFTVNNILAKLGEPPAEHQWGDMCHADIEIAKNAARSAGVIEDPALPQQGGKGTQPAAGPASKPAPKGKN